MRANTHLLDKITNLYSGVFKFFSIFSKAFNMFWNHRDIKQEIGNSSLTLLILESLDLSICKVEFSDPQMPTKIIEIKKRTNRIEKSKRKICFIIDQRQI